MVIFVSRTVEYFLSPCLSSVFFQLLFLWTADGRIRRPAVLFIAESLTVSDLICQSPAGRLYRSTNTSRLPSVLCHARWSGPVPSQRPKQCLKPAWVSVPEPATPQGADAWGGEGGRRTKESHVQTAESAGGLRTEVKLHWHVRSEGFCSGLVLVQFLKFTLNRLCTNMILDQNQTPWC